ncbi:hypothetical protein LTR94_026762 [Friedmanniomyces endolithicus]|nr:hypothetical protein LTR94_026762 [Friedmanniomyces endolithicus]
MTELTKRALGDSGLEIAPLVFGGNVFGWTADQPTSFALLDAFVDAGFDAIDTADAYSRWVQGHEGGESETVIGQWLQARGRRDDVKIFTKVGSDMGQGHNDLSARWIEQAVEASLRRLQTDYIDLYQTHWPDPLTPQDETLKALDALVSSGKALEISKQEGLAAYGSLQPHYNLYSRKTFEDGLQPLALEADLGVITYFSLESGFLSGKYKTADQIVGAKREGMLKDKFNERGIRILAVLEAVAQRNEASSAQTALAWLLAQPGVTAPIVSATSLGQLSDTLAAATLSLSLDDIEALNEASEE